MAKPLIRYATTIDFGQLTFEADLDRILEDAGVATLVRRMAHRGLIDEFRWSAMYVHAFARLTFFLFCRLRRRLVLVHLVDAGPTPDPRLYRQSLAGSVVGRDSR